MRPDVDQSDIVAVERLVVAGVDTDPLSADRIRFRAEEFGSLGIVHDGPDLVAYELGEYRVRLRIAGRVGECPDELESVAGIPRTFHHVRPLLLGVVEDRAWIGDVLHKHRATGFQDLLAPLGVVGLPVLFVRGVDLPVERREAEVRCSLEDGEVFGHRSDLRGELDSG